MTKIIEQCLLIITLLIAMLDFIVAANINVLSDLPVVQDYEKNNDAFTKIERSMIPRMQAQNFTGPAHLKVLMNSCYDLKDDIYKYVLCPFVNMTQEESRSFFDSYRGIMGVWGEWEIINDTFVGMRLIEGSSCESGKYRTTVVKMKCGSINKLIEVKEPQKCYYEAIFQSPLICGRNAMLVYPRLPVNLQLKWDNLHEEYLTELFTDKGYQSELNKLFKEAGYLLDAKKRQSLLIKEETKEISLQNSCSEQIEALKRRIADLELRLRLKDDYIE